MVAHHRDQAKNLTKLHRSLLPQEETLEMGRKTQKLSIGVPLEEDQNENRIALTPLAVDVLVNQGHDVMIESGAGKNANFSDTDFSEKGGFITNSKEEIYQCDILLKVSPLSLDEIELLKGNQLLISAINIGILSKSHIQALMKKRVTAIGYELLKDENNCYPIVRSMSEIIGSTAILKAAEYLSQASIGKGKILGGITGVNPSEIIILGAGTTGEFAAKTAMGLGAVVKVFDQSIYRLREMQRNLHQPVFTSIIQPKILSNAIHTADIVIGAMNMLDPTSRFMLSDDLVKRMKKGSVIIDTSIDQGGCFETSRLTTHKNPIFVEHGIVHYCVPNITSTVARTASYALSNVFAPILSRLGDAGSFQSLIREDHGLRHGIYVFNGILTNYQIGKYFDLPSKDIDLLVATL